MDRAVAQLLTLIEWDYNTTLPVTIADVRLSSQDLLETCEILSEKIQEANATIQQLQQQAVPLPPRTTTSYPHDQI